MKALLSRDMVQRALSLSSLALLFLFFALFAPYFLTPPNLRSILLSSAVNGILALGVTFVIITGGIDLSIGTAMTFSSVLAALGMSRWGLPIAGGVFLALGAGLAWGLVTGLLVTKAELPPFIATLGMMMITKGLSLVVSGVKPVYFPLGEGGPRFTDIASTQVFGVPSAVLIFFLLALLGDFILRRTLLGRYALAIGSNREATRLSGVNVDRWLLGVYALKGLFVGAAGVVLASRLGSAQPSLGQGYELEAIAAVIIGGTSLQGGKGTIPGTVIGTLLLSVLLSGLRMMGLPQEWQAVVTGAIVIGAVALDVCRKKGGPLGA